MSGVKGRIFSCLCDKSQTGCSLPLLSLLLGNLLGQLVAPEARADGLTSLLHHVGVHDVQTRPPDGKKAGVDIGSGVPVGKLAGRQAVGERGKDTHGLRDGTDGVENIEGGVSAESSDDGNQSRGDTVSGLFDKSQEARGREEKRLTEPRAWRDPRNRGAGWRRKGIGCTR